METMQPFSPGKSILLQLYLKIKDIDARQRSLCLRRTFHFIYYKSLILFYLIFFTVFFGVPILFRDEIPTP